MSIPTFIRSYVCSAAIAPFLIVKFSDAANSSKIAAAAAATDPLWGVSDAMGGVQDGPCDVILSGLGEVTLGGTVSAGDPLTSDADGKAVKCVGAAGEVRRIVGFAEQPGVAGDRIQARISPSILQLPSAG